MARTSRARSVWSLLGLVLVSTIAASALSRVRSSNPVIAAALVTAQERSPTVVSGGGFRLLRILVDDVADVVSLMATIGHELRHAIELLTEPGVRTNAAAYLYYAREAPTAMDAFETPAAIRAGTDVLRELHRAGAAPASAGR